MLDWIDCDIRLPAVYEEVLTVIVGTDYIIQEDGETLEDAMKRARNKPVRVKTSILDEDGFWCDGATGFPEIIRPSYWMPFPEPPKELIKNE